MEKHEKISDKKWAWATVCPSLRCLWDKKFLIKITALIIVLYAIGSRDIPDYYSRRKITVLPKKIIPVEQLLESYETALAQTGCSITTKLLLVCTRSKSCVKTVLRHIWKDYEELADDAKYTSEYQNLYARRKETIERVFADAQEKRGMRYTHYRGLAPVSIG